MAIQISTAGRNARMDALTSNIGTSATIKLYTASRPANPGTAISTQTLLVTLTCNATAFAGASSNGTITLNAITSGTAVATGTATWYRLSTSGGTAVIDGNVGTSGSDLNLGTTSIATGNVVSISSATFTDGNA